MSALLHGRLWRALLGLAFVLATAMPAFTSYATAAALPPCAAEQALSGAKPGCSDHTAQALTCGFAVCAAAAIATAEPALRGEQITLAAAFPPDRPQLVVGATLPPDPFPPRTLFAA